jgi:cell wall-associated NlpC family hydrolase
MITAPAWAADYVGLPWAPGGRTRAGLDCWGLYATIRAERFSGPPPPYAGPAWAPGADADAIADAVEAYARSHRQIRMAEAAPGDAVLIRLGRWPIHVGTVVAPGLMLHIERKCESCVERLSHPLWTRRVVGFYRHEAAP